MTIQRPSEVLDLFYSFRFLMRCISVHFYIERAPADHYPSSPFDSAVDSPAGRLLDDAAWLLPLAYDPRLNLI